MTTKTYKKFVARNVSILNLTRRPNSLGEVFPPELYATFDNPVSVIYNNDHSKAIGKAYIMRVQNTIIADIHVTSGVDDDSEAKTLIQQMYPAINAAITDSHDNHVFQINIKAVSLSFNKNVDPFILPLGTKVVRVRKPIV